MARRTKKKTETKREVVGMEWVGDGTETISTVPPRDLSPEETELHRGLIEAVQENTGRTLYVERFQDVEVESTEADEVQPDEVPDEDKDN